MEMLEEEKVLITPKKNQDNDCYHCGEPCKEENLMYEEKNFCCQGCQTVYAMLSQNDLTQYYKIIEKKGKYKENYLDFSYLDLPEIQEKLLQYTDGTTAKITFYLPQIHCSACIWLLENLYKLNENITYSRVDFPKKQISITFQIQKISLKTIAEVLKSIGYAPHITLEDTDEEELSYQIERKERNKLIGKIAVAGFGFGNIMMISFPEYFGFDTTSEQSFKIFFQSVNILLILPVFFYSGIDYLISAYQNIKKKYLNLDFPLALGMIVLLLRSLLEIFTNTGAGYLDTLAGLIFFLLLGKWFQLRTYTNLRYDRDFKSYFPVAIMVQNEQGQEEPKTLAQLKKGDVIAVRNQELIPTDAILK
jgi:Cu+-exporting ATPase